MHFSLANYALAATHFYSKPLLLLHHSCAQNVLQCRQGAPARTCSDTSLHTSSLRRAAVVVRAVAEAGRDASSTANSAPPGSKSPVVNKAKKKFAKKHPSKQQIKQQLKLKDKKKSEQHQQQQRQQTRAQQKQMQQKASHQPQLSQEQRKQHQQQAGEPQVQQTDAVSAASAAAAAIQAANQLLQPAGALGQEPTPASGNSSSTGPQPFSDKVSGISYVLGYTHRADYRAAGVVVYDFEGPQQEPRVLLVREKTGIWNLPAGKLNRSADGPQRPEATAARELEEESHGLIPAAASLAVLPSCPQWYCPSSKMVMYMMRYAGGQQLPDLLEQRLAAGMKHPDAEGVDKMCWFSSRQLRQGVVGRGRRNARSSSAAAATAAGLQQDDAADAAAEGADEAEEAEEAEEIVTSGVMTAKDLEAVASLQLQEPGEHAITQQQDEQQQQHPEQQQQQDDEQPLRLRMPLFKNKNRIASWLTLLGRDQAPAVGLQVVQQQQQQEQQQQQQGEQEQQDQQQLLKAPDVEPIQLPVKWSAYDPKGSATTGTVAAAAAAAAAVHPSSGGLGGQDFLSTGGAAGAAAGGARGLAAAAAAPGGSAAGQPWALAVWSGRHAREQQEQADQQQQQQKQEKEAHQDG